jgi:hypothetical protein
MTITAFVATVVNRPANWFGRRALQLPGATIQVLHINDCGKARTASKPRALVRRIVEIDVGWRGA